MPDWSNAAREYVTCPLEAFAVNFVVDGASKYVAKVKLEQTQRAAGRRRRVARSDSSGCIAPDERARGSY